jgi:decaprenyl-diphosphate synthase subunit 2
MGGNLVRDYIESKFLGDRDEQNYPLPSDPNKLYNGNFDLNLNEIELIKSFDPREILGHPKREWTYRTALNHGSTLGYCCRGALKIANVPQPYLDQSYKFGRNFAMTLQAFNELEPFRRHGIGEDEQFSLVSAPVLFHLKHDPSIYEEIKKGEDSIANVNYSKLHQAVLNGPGIEKTKELIKEHSKKALEALEVFNNTDAKESLKNLVYSMEVS